MMRDDAWQARLKKHTDRSNQTEWESRADRTTRRFNPVWNSVKKSIWKNKAETLIMTAFIIGSVITSLLPPLLLEKGVDRLAENRSISLGLAVGYLLLIALADWFESGQGAAITVLGQKITHGLRSELCAKLNRLPTDYYKSHDSGMTASVFVNDADTIDTLYSDGIVGMIADSFKIISILAIIFIKSPGLGLILLGVTPLLFWLTRIFQKRTLQAQSDNRRAIAKVSNHVPETIRNIRMIHVFQKEKYMEDKYDAYISESYDAVNRSNIYDSIYSPIILLTQAIVVAIMMVAAAQGEDMQKFFGMTVGSAVAIIAYVGKIFSPLESLGMEIQNIQSAMSGIRRINEFLLQEEWTPQICGEEPKDGSIEFANVTFGYEKDLPVLKNFSFYIKEGENVTFMGRTGSGKTTIFRLLTGLYEPQLGMIRAAGYDPVTIPAWEKRKVYGIVEQKFAQVPGSVRDQVTLSDDRITDQMIWEALEMVQLADVIRDFEKGLDTPMQDGIFSQGQIQLLSIARAVVTSPKILLLDEITANLDSETEAQVLSALKNAARGRTVLSISHRYSDIMKDERIISV